MSTHALPAGTCNFPVNMPKPMRAALGRFSNLQGFRSIGAWIRGVLSLYVGVVRLGWAPIPLMVGVFAGGPRRRR